LQSRIRIDWAKLRDCILNALYKHRASVTSTSSEENRSHRAVFRHKLLYAGKLELAGQAAGSPAMQPSWQNENGAGVGKLLSVVSAGWPASTLIGEKVVSFRSSSPLEGGALIPDA
jgi:hypothetical protein